MVDLELDGSAHRDAGDRHGRGGAGRIILLVRRDGECRAGCGRIVGRREALPVGIGIGIGRLLRGKDVRLVRPEVGRIDYQPAGGLIDERGHLTKLPGVPTAETCRVGGFRPFAT